MTQQDDTSQEDLLATDLSCMISFLVNKEGNIITQVHVEQEESDIIAFLSLLQQISSKEFIQNSLRDISNSTGDNTYSMVASLMDLSKTTEYAIRPSRVFERGA